MNAVYGVIPYVQMRRIGRRCSTRTAVAQSLTDAEFTPCCAGLLLIFMAGRAPRAPSPAPSSKSAAANHAAFDLGGGSLDADRRRSSHRLGSATGGASPHAGSWASAACCADMPASSAGSAVAPAE